MKKLMIICTAVILCGCENAASKKRKENYERFGVHVQKHISYSMYQGTTQTVHAGVDGKEGVEIYLDRFDQIRREINWRRGKKHGLEIRRYENGQISAEFTWEDDKRVKVKYFARKDTVIID